LIAVVVLLQFREERDYRASPAPQAALATDITVSTLYAGGVPTGASGANTKFELNGYDVAEGKRLYNWFNCVGCHANGGGDIGPALMDDKWIYGSAPANIRATIIEGRPNGMPSFRGKLTEAEIWQIVAYIRSMSGQVPVYAAPGRNDDIRSKKPETIEPKVEPKTQPRPGGAPPADR
jgi:cytochrome c oxidase cbb3-type subunit 3